MQETLCQNSIVILPSGIIYFNVYRHYLLGEKGESRQRKILKQVQQINFIFEQIKPTVQRRNVQYKLDNISLSYIYYTLYYIQTNLIVKN